MDLNANRDLADLALLDPARGREPDARQWVRARASVDRIVAGEDAAAAGHVRPMSRHRRFALVGAVAAVAAAGVVAVPALLPGTAQKAFAGWTAEPVELTGIQALPLAEKCADGWDTGSVSAADVIIAERRGVATLLILRRGAGTAECLSLDSKNAGARMGLFDGPAPAPPAGTATIETMSSYGSGDSQYSNVVGLVGSAVTGVDVILPDGRVIETSVRAGWWAAWWPGPEGGEVNTIRVVVHSAAGDATFIPEQLFPG